MASSWHCACLATRRATQRPLPFSPSRPAPDLLLAPSDDSLAQPDFCLLPLQYTYTLHHAYYILLHTYLTTTTTSPPSCARAPTRMSSEHACKLLHALAGDPPCMHAVPPPFIRQPYAIPRSPSLFGPIHHWCWLSSDPTWLDTHTPPASSSCPVRVRRIPFVVPSPLPLPIHVPFGVRSRVWPGSPPRALSQ